MKIAILMLTYNAPRYVIKTLWTLRMTQGVDFELICVDNASRWKTRVVVMLAYWFGWIDRLCLSRRNTLFAGGNNLAAKLATSEATHFLLLNSDIEIRRSDWLLTLVECHRPGLTSFGVVEGSPVDRLDGYCLLIDREIYEKYQLDEAFQWYWAVTRLQALALVDGYAVQGFAEHEEYLHHFGGKSGPGFVGAKGMDTESQKVIGWFADRKISVLDNNSYSRVNPKGMAQ
jgi:hypothetical protein